MTGSDGRDRAEVGLHRVLSLAAASHRHPDARRVDSARTKRSAIRAFYRALDAPDYAAANLDALADILGDLGWLPDGPIVLLWAGTNGLEPRDGDALQSLVAEVAAESAGSSHPLTVYLSAGR